MHNWHKRIMLIFLGLSLAACTTVDPYTGQTYVDQGRTAALLGGLALAGAAAYAIDKERDDDHDYDYDYGYDYDDDHDYDHDYGHHYDHDRGRRYRDVFRPAKGIVCYSAYQACYKNGDYSKRWTRRIYPRSAGYRR